MAVTDYHKQIRDAEVTVIAALYPGITVTALDDLDTAAASLPSMPFIGVVCVGPEAEAPSFHTNLEDGLRYSCMVGLFAAGAANGVDDTVAPEMTQFRRQMRVTFHNKRLSAVSRVGWCEVSDSGPVVDRNSPCFQKLSTAVVVTAVGRFPRS